MFATLRTSGRPPLQFRGSSRRRSPESRRAGSGAFGNRGRRHIRNRGRRWFLPRRVRRNQWVPAGATCSWNTVFIDQHSGAGLENRLERCRSSVAVPVVGHQRVFQQDRWLQAPQVVLEFGHGQSPHLGPCESHVWVLPQEFDQLVDVADVLVRAAVESGAGDNDPAPEPLVFDIDKDVGDGRVNGSGPGASAG